MKDIITTIKYFLSVLIGYLCFLIGDINEMLKFLTFLMIIDFLTGIIKGIVNKSLNSKIIFIGGYRKALIYLIIIVGNFIDSNFSDMFLRETIIIYYIIQEWISIMENINTYITLPEELQQFFSQMKGEDKDEKV